MFLCCGNNSGDSAVKSCRQTILDFFHHLKSSDNVRDPSGHYWSYHNARVVLTNNTLTIQPVKTRFFDEDVNACTPCPWAPQLQIVLHMYASPYEVLQSFDLGSCAIAYDSHSVFLHERAIRAFLTRSNVLIPQNYSERMCQRITKYATRGFGIFVPDLKVADVSAKLFDLQKRHDRLCGEKQFYSEFDNEYLIAKLLLLNKQIVDYGDILLTSLATNAELANDGYSATESKLAVLGHLSTLKTEIFQDIPLFPGPINRGNVSIARQWRYALRQTGTLCNNNKSGCNH